MQEKDSLNLNNFAGKPKEHKEVSSLSEISEDLKSVSSLSGINPDEKERSGSFFLLDQSVICARSSQKGIEVQNIASALKKNPWLADYFWKAIDPDKDEFTRVVKDATPCGYFIRSLPGVETIFPLQSCLFLNSDQTMQKVHNVIIAEEGSHLHIISGCASSKTVNSGLHIGISEFYVKKSASITFTMIHNWNENIDVRPRSVSFVEEGGTFMSNYICMVPVKTLQLYPATHLIGKGARAVYNSIVLGKKDSLIDIGSRIFLKAADTSAESIARTVAQDKSVIYARGHLIGEVPDIRAHLECRGLVLSDEAKIHAIPELEAKCSNLEMSHEAAVGKIADKEILYLMSRGLSKDEATSAIIRGFLNVDIVGLPEKLKMEIKKITDMEFKG